MKFVFILFTIFFSLESIAIELTKEENEYLKSNPTIKVHNESNWVPFNFNEKGEAKGLSIDIMNLVAKKVGLKVEYVSGYSWNEFLNMIKTKKLDVMLNIVPNEEREKFLVFTTPYQLVSNTVVLNKSSTKEIKNINDLSKLTIAVEEGYINHKFMKDNYPNTKLILKKDTLAVLQAISYGEAEATFGVLPTIHSIIERNGINNLKFTPIEDDKLFVPKELCIATSNENKILRNILQKGLDSLSQEEKSTITKKWIDTKIININYKFIFEILGIFLLIFSGTLYWVLRLKKLQKKLENSNLLINTMLNALPNPIFYKDKNAKFIGFNKAYEEAFGINKEELLGKTVLELEYLPQEDRKKYQKEDLKIIKGSKSITREQTMILKDGNIHHTIYSVNGFKDIENNPAGLIGVFVDITKQKEIEEKLQSTMDELQEMNKRIKDSIDYSGVLQSALISSPEILKKYFKESYAVWQAKDTVGGDIYIFEEINKDECLLFLIDCTGHGVPGALVTVLVKSIERNIFAHIINGKDKEISPANLLAVFNKSIKNLLKQNDKASLSNAGFDGAILYYNKKTNLLKFASSNTFIIHLRNDNVIEYKGDRQSVGYKTSSDDFVYAEHLLDVKEDDLFFISTDGLYDQNGGKKDLPMGRKKIKNILLENKDEPLNDIKELILYELGNYQGKNERNDDISFLSFKI